ncbi:MAG: hypothetical protein QM679_04110 [Patulibacter sp.]
MTRDEYEELRELVTFDIRNAQKMYRELGHPASQTPDSFGAPIDLSTTTRALPSDISLTIPAGSSSR